MAEQNLKETTARGLLWGTINNGGQQVLNLVFGIFLARLLSPEEYGMVGMLTIFALIASSLQESGFTSALNRKRDICADDYNAVFWFNVICSLTLYAVLFVASPYIAAWFRQPELVPLSRLTFLSFVLSALGTTPRAYLFRNIRVKETAWIQLTALFTSGLTGVILAWNGFSYWGIAIQNLTYCGMVSAVSWYVSGWRPMLRIHLKPLRGMIGFSSKLLVTNVFMHLNNNLFSVFFGRLYGEHMVGCYNQANKWTYLAYTTLNGTLWGVTQPVFARLEDDTERKRRAFRKMLRFTAFVSCPTLFGLALIAPEFITLLITDKWINSAQMMQILCVGGAFVPISSFYSNFLISQGRSGVFMWNTIGLCLLQIAALLLLYPYGVKVMIVVYVALGIMWLPMWHRFVRRMLHLSFLRALLDIAPFVFISGSCMVAAHFASMLVESTLPRMLVKMAVGAACYIGVMGALRVVVFRESVEFLLSIVRKKRG